MVEVKDRLVSLDVFRGFTLAGMILVNMLGIYYATTPGLLKHAPWIGLTLADLVFPFFLFIVGVSMNFSFASRSKQPSWKVWGKFLFRIAVLYILGVALVFGLFFYGVPDFSTIRIPGILQLIALSSLFAAPFVRARTRWILLAASIILFIQASILLWVSAPGVPAGSLDMSNNIAGWIDTHVFTTSHLLEKNFSFDPEGLMAVINGTAMVIIGLACGRTLRLHRDWRGVQLLLAGGILALTFGLILSPVLPIIKQLWTSSFILVNAGLAAIILGLLYALMDILKRGKILNVGIPFGRNALILYILSDILGILIFVAPSILPGGGVVDVDDTVMPILFLYFGPMWGTVIFGLIIVAFWWVVALILHWNRIYIKL